MARTGRPITTPDDLKKNRFSRNWEDVYKALKREATARVTQMTKWRKWQEEKDAEGMLDEYEEAGVFARIEESRLLNVKIQDWTRHRTAAIDKIVGLSGSIEFMTAQINATLIKLPSVEDGLEIDRLTQAIEEAKEKIKGWEAEIRSHEARIEEVEAFQWDCARQIIKNFCKVHETIIALGGGNPDIENEEDRDAFEEYEYNLEDY